MKKKLALIFVMIALVSLISVSADLGDFFRAGLTPIEDFFSGGWQNYEKSVSFILFFFLFFSAYLIGMKKSMGELTRAHTVFAVAAAFLSSFIIVISMGFEWVNLAYIAWFLIGVLILFLIYSLLSKVMEKNKFWAFVLALILTALLLWLIWYLMNEGRPLDGFGRVSQMFGQFRKGTSSSNLLGENPIQPEDVPSGGGAGGGTGGTGSGAGGGGTGGTGSGTNAKTGTSKMPKGALWLIVAVAVMGTAIAGRTILRRVGPLRRVRDNWRLNRRVRRLVQEATRITTNNPFSQRDRQQVSNNLTNAIQSLEQIRQTL